MVTLVRFNFRVPLRLYATFRSSISDTIDTHGDLVNSDYPVVFGGRLCIS